ncbi:sensor histidine kinase [Aquincola tertiaricarbonis]|uniref:sensor histidine kinase n=1 Tax=Aquincola tertiaricarbonis TaxID=391953 RepID=UPI0018DBF694|nr:ATP-binding protein [Aquincola tertiaricarbonis]
MNVLGDATRLHQVFTNLQGNAIEFSASGSEVRVDLERRAPETRVRITDHGVGLTAEQAGKVFEPFRQASGHHTGGGLRRELAIVRSLVEPHKGRVQLISEGLGLGCVFQVFIPAA